MNPFLPLDEYIPDGEPRVFGDRVYLYGSHDVFGDFSYCSTEYYVYSASIYNLEHWTNHGVTFASAGPNDQVFWSDAPLYAPDVIEKEGIYYLYFCLSDGSEGVATSNSPAGPFSNSKRMYYPSSIHEGAALQHIDPGVLLDDDGKVYYYWGQNNAQAAQLRDNMFEIIPETYVEDLINESTHFFHEASSMRKIGDIYYYIFCDISTGKANNLSYATSKQPLGPFTYQGVIINNNDTDPLSWNNHGSIIEILGQWYIFYHRSSNNSVYSRRACAEPIYFEKNGRIIPVEMTTQGFSASPSAFSRMSSARACQLYGGNYITQVEPSAHALVNNRNGNYAGFKYLEFGNGNFEKEMNFIARLCPKTDGAIEIIMDSIDGPVLGKVYFKKQDKDIWMDISTPIDRVNGKHAVYLKFVGNETESICDLNWFAFEISSPMGL